MRDAGTVTDPEVAGSRGKSRRVVRWLAVGCGGIIAVMACWPFAPVSQWWGWTITYCSVAACLTLCFIAAQKRGLRGNLVGECLSVIAWLSMPLWLDRAAMQVFKPMEPIFPEFLFDGLKGMFTELGLRVSLVYILVVTMVVAPVYGLAARSLAAMALTLGSCFACMGISTLIMHLSDSAGTITLITYVACAVAPIAWWAFLSSPRKTPGRCVECGYDLAGIRGEKCPECGKRIEEVTSEPA